MVLHNKMERMVWVTVGRAEHQAWLLEDIQKGQDTVLIRWETTRAKERVDVKNVQQSMPSRRTRRETTHFNYDERNKEKETKRAGNNK